MKVNLGLYQLDIFNIPSWVSFGHFYASFCKCLSGMPYILGKRLSKSVFESPWFQIAKAFQSLLCDGRAAAVVNKTCTCWATIVRSFYFCEINRKRSTVNSIMFMSLHWDCGRCFGCGRIITFTLNFFNIFGDIYTRDGTISLCQRDASAVVMNHNHSTQVLDPFRSPPPWSSTDMIVKDTHTRCAWGLSYVI